MVCSWYCNNYPFFLLVIIETSFHEQTNGKGDFMNVIYNIGFPGQFRIFFIPF